MDRIRRSAIVCGVAMCGTALLGAAGRPSPRSDAPPALDRLVPEAFDDWRVDELTRAFVRPPDLQGKEYGIYDQVLERTFVNRQRQRVMLSAAFGGEQSAGLQMHRPEICYRAAGFRVRDLHVVPLRLAGQEIPATRLHAELPGRSEPITYWTLLGGVAVADHSAFRWRRITAALKREVLDGMLVRISSIDQDAQRAYVLHAQFADALACSLSTQAQALLVGRQGGG